MYHHVPLEGGRGWSCWFCRRTECTEECATGGLCSCLLAVGLLFPFPRFRAAWGSRAAFLTVIHKGSGFNCFSTYFKGKTLAYCIPVVQSLQAMKTKIQVSVEGASLLIAHGKPSAGSTAVTLHQRAALPSRCFLTSHPFSTQRTASEGCPACGRLKVFTTIVGALTGTCVRRLPDAWPV